MLSEKLATRVHGIFGEKDREKIVAFLETNFDAEGQATVTGICVHAQSAGKSGAEILEVLESAFQRSWFYVPPNFRGDIRPEVDIGGRNQRIVLGIYHKLGVPSPK